MAEKVVSVRLEAKTQGFVAGFQKARASVDDLTKADVPSKAKAFGDLANKAALAGVAVAAGIGVAVKRFAEFDEAMSAVKANSGAVGQEFENLRTLAVDLGASSIFSAKEAAQGINELAKAGVATRDIMGGGLKGALDLAAAGQVDVGFAAETAATAMVQFNLEGSKVPHIADLLTNAANKAQGGVADMAMALKQAGLVAASTGLSIEETTAGLTAFASAGLIGSDAGTSFKTMLMRLNPQSVDAAAAMEEIGLHAYDAQGNFIGLEMVAGQLQDGLRGLSQEQRTQAINTIFGADAARAATVLYNTGAAGIARWTKEVSESGAAAEQARTLTDNLNGDIERLGGSLDSVFIQTGSSANDSLRTLVQGLTGVVDFVGKIPGPVLLAGGALASLALLAPKGVLMWRQYKATLDSLGLSLGKITERAPRTGRAIESAGKAATRVAIGLTAASVAYQSFADKTRDLGAEQLQRDLSKASDAVAVLNKALAGSADIAASFDSDITSVGAAIQTAFKPGVGDQINNALNALGSFVSGENDGNMAMAAKRIGEIDAALAGLATSGQGDAAAKAFKQVTDEAARQGISVEELKKKFPQYAEAIAGSANAATNAAGPTGELSKTTQEVQKAADDAQTALENLKDAILGLGDPVAQQRAANRDYEAAIDDLTASVKDNGKTLDAHTEKGRANQAALDAIRDATLKKVVADFEATRVTKGVDAATASATKAMQNGRDAFVNAAVAAGKTKKEAEALATQLGLVPKDVSILVEQHGAAAAGAQIDYAARDRQSMIFVTERINRQITQTDMGTDKVNRYSPKRAAGGPIWGPGTKTSDSVPILASAGEFMQKAAAVDKYGLKFMHDVNSLRFPKALARGYAGGGEIVSNYAPRQQVIQVTTPAPTASVPVVGGPTFNAYGMDADAAVQRAMRQWEHKMAVSA